MRLLLSCLSVALASCSLFGPRIVESGGLRVTVDWSHAARETDALVMADDYCQKYGKIARLADHKSEHESVYECVAP